MKSRLWVVGSTGMLGQHLVSEGDRRGWDVQGVARRHADITLDLSDLHALRAALGRYRPAVLINAAAVTSLNQCENQPGEAYLINTRAAGELARYAYQCGAYFVQVSTDHYYRNDKDRLHREDESVILVNEYARSKWLGEALVRVNDPSALVVRTNIVGLRGWEGAPSFVEWAIHALRQREPMTLFNDYFASSIDTGAMAEALFKLIHLRPAGVLNVGASEVFSKQVFIEALAKRLGLSTDYCNVGSVMDFSEVPRAESLGLDVSCAEGLLSQALPSLAQVIDNLAGEYEKRECHHAL